MRSVVEFNIVPWYFAAVGVHGRTAQVACTSQEPSTSGGGRELESSRESASQLGSELRARKGDFPATQEGTAERADTSRRGTAAGSDESASHDTTHDCERSCELQHHLRRGAHVHGLARLIAAQLL